MGISEARLGSKKFLPEMRSFATFFRDILDRGIPGHEGINAIQWCKRFGRGLLEHNAVYQWQKQQREPSIRMAVLAGILLKRSGAKIDVYAPLLAAADGCYSMWMEKLRQDPDCGIEEENDRLALGKPQKVSLDLTAEYAVSVYKSLPWKDRLSAANGMLETIARDVRFSQITDDREIVRELIKEAADKRGNVSTLANAADVLEDWLKSIVAGDWDKVQEVSKTEDVMKLSGKVKNLDGKTGDPRIFAPLLAKDLVREYLKEAKKRMAG